MTEDSQWTGTARERFATQVDGAGYQPQHAGGLSAPDDVPGMYEDASATWVPDAADDESRQALTAALGSVEDGGHEWDGDPAEWVRRQRGQAT